MLEEAISIEEQCQHVSLPVSNTLFGTTALHPN